jgi:hypothetical protein
VEIVTERDSQLLDDLRDLVEAKRRELQNSAGAPDDTQPKDKA